VSAKESSAEDSSCQYKLRCLECFEVVSHAEVTGGEVVQHDPIQQNRKDAIHKYQIVREQDGQIIEILVEFQDKNTAEKLLVLLEQGIWTEEDIEDYTPAEIQDEYIDKVVHG
jgi:hypothetical protein